MAGPPPSSIPPVTTPLGIWPPPHPARVRTAATPATADRRNPVRCLPRVCESARLAERHAALGRNQPIAISATVPTTTNVKPLAVITTYSPSADIVASTLPTGANQSPNAGALDRRRAATAAMFPPELKTGGGRPEPCVAARQLGCPAERHTRGTVPGGVERPPKVLGCPPPHTRRPAGGGIVGRSWARRGCLNGAQPRRLREYPRSWWRPTSFMPCAAGMLAGTWRSRGTTNPLPRCPSASCLCHA